MSKEYTVAKKFVHRCGDEDKVFNVGDTPPEDEGKLYSSYLIPSGFIVEKGTKASAPVKAKEIKTDDPKDAPVPQPVKVESELDMIKTVEANNPKTKEPKVEEGTASEPVTEEAPKPAPAKKKAFTKKKPTKRVNKES